MLPLERAFWPFWPRPAVLPRPDPTPRPMRRSLVTAPTGGLSFERMSDMTRLPFDLLNRDQMQNLFDHAAERRRVGHRDLGAGAAQTEPLHDEAGGMRRSDDALDLFDLELLRLHPAPPVSGAGAA